MAKQLAPLHEPIGLINQVRDNIAEAIYRGDLEPNERVVAPTLAQQLKVETNIVVLAMLELVRYGLIYDAGRTGMKVAPIDPVYMARLYQVRGALDAGAAREAARNGTPAQWKHLKAILARGDAAMHSSDHNELVASDMAFHLHIYEMSENPLFAQLTDSLWGPLRRVMREVLLDEASQDQVGAEHAAIAEALMARDGARAADLMHHHVADATRRLARTLAQQRKGG